MVVVPGFMMRGCWQSFCTMASEQTFSSRIAMYACFSVRTCSGDTGDAGIPRHEQDCVLRTMFAYHRVCYSACYDESTMSGSVSMQPLEIRPR